MSLQLTNRVRKNFHLVHEWAGIYVGTGQKMDFISSVVKQNFPIRQNNEHSHLIVPFLWVEKYG